MEDLPPEQKNESNESSDISPVRPHTPSETGNKKGGIVASFTRSVYQGPLPPPEVLKGYDIS